MDDKLCHYNKAKNCYTIRIKVQANAKVNKIDGIICINSQKYLKLSINAVPRDGRANEAIVEFLSKLWKINKKSINIISGHNNSFKLLSIDSISCFDQLIKEFILN